MPFAKADVIAAASAVTLPDNRTLAAAGLIHGAQLCDGFAKVQLAPIPEPLVSEITRRVQHAVSAAAQSAGEPLQSVNIEFVDPSAPRKTGAPKSTPEKTGRGAAAVGGSGGAWGDAKIIAVGAGKGGVGKSTVSVNLAVALARKGYAVGVMDGDIYGPSMPTLLGLDSMDTIVLGNQLQTFCVHGIKAMTLGKLVDPDKPLIWRGPMAHGAFKQIAEQTAWGDLDYLIVDLPPGTGDVPLTMAQLMPVTGAIVVCTPQKVAQDDAVRAVRMFQQLNIPVMGVIENMSYFVGDDEKTYDIFGRGGAEQMAQRMGLPFLGAIPINMQLRANSDAGTPIANFEESGDTLREALETVAQRAESETAIAMMQSQSAAPKLTIS